jgi:hypothetical protein
MRRAHAGSFSLLLHRAQSHGWDVRFFLGTVFIRVCPETAIAGRSSRQEQARNTKYGGLSTPQRTMKLSAAPVEMTILIFRVVGWCGLLVVSIGSIFRDRESEVRKV